MIWVKQGLRMYSIKFYWNKWCRDGLPWSYNQDFKPCKLEEEKVETYFCGAFLENLVLIQNLYNLQTRIICSTRPWPGHPVEGKTSKAKVSYTNAYWYHLMQWYREWLQILETKWPTLHHSLTYSHQDNTTIIGWTDFENIDD